MMLRLTAALAAALLLAACGGSSSDQAPRTTTPDPEETRTTTCPDGSTVPAGQACPEPPREVARLPLPYTPSGHYGIDGLPAPTATDAEHMPIYRDDERLYVGVDQGSKATDYFTVNGQVHSLVRSSGLSGLPAVAERGDVEIRHGRLSDDAGRAAVAAYLGEASRGLASVPRWQSLPEVRLVGTSTAAERRRLIVAVQLVNAALPPGARLSVGASSEPRDQGIDVEFVDCYGARHTCGGGSAAASTPTWIRNEGDGERMVDAHVYFSRETSSYGDDRETVILLAHELIHALGINNHISADFATIMRGTGAIHHAEQNGQPQPLSLLYAIDREALRALYGRLEIGDGPEDIGPWGANSTHLVGNGEHANFGVALRNGYAEPWAYGPRPTTALADNPALAGGVTWVGTLLGLTPAARSVTGEARIGVDLATLVGAASFVGLESWTGAPGDPGTGAQWLDGDLGYSLVVRGNTFRETGGDAGRVTGVFVGAAHEGAGGALERDDLTAAFGVAR